MPRVRCPHCRAIVLEQTSHERSCRVLRAQKKREAYAEIISIKTTDPIPEPAAEKDFGEISVLEEAYKIKVMEVKGLFLAGITVDEQPIQEEGFTVEEAIEELKDTAKRYEQYLISKSKPENPKTEDSSEDPIQIEESTTNDVPVEELVAPATETEIQESTEESIPEVEPKPAADIPADKPVTPVKNTPKKKK